MKSLEVFALCIACGLLVGSHLQTMGMRMNTPLKFIDLTLNFCVIGYFLYVSRNWVGVPVLVGGMAIWAAKSYANIFPLLRLIVNYMNADMTQNHITAMIKIIKHEFKIEGFNPIDSPCIYIANHGMGSLDDILAMGTLTGDNISVVANRSPGGFKGVEGGRKYMCVLPEGGGRFEAMKKIVEEEVVRGGKSLVVYPENMKYKKDGRSLAPFRSGIFKICWEGGIPVVPLLIEWPSLFPTIFTDTQKTLRVATGTPVYPNHFSTPEKFMKKARETLGSLKGIQSRRRLN
jgi:1-acyl-sn-glycerol-3-phosphate acyltransferase